MVPLQIKLNITLHDYQIFRNQAQLATVATVNAAIIRLYINSNQR